MNNKILTKLKPSLLGLGDATHNVVLLKTFLKSHPNIPTGDLQINNSYDKATQDAVAYVQRNKGLTPTGRMDPDTWMALGTESNPIQIKGLFASDRTIQSLMGAGYLLKRPPVRKAKENNSVIRTSSAQQTGASDYWYNFTFRVFVTVFAPFDWFGPLSLSAGDKGDRGFGTDPDASYRLQCFSTVTAAPGDRKYNWNVTRKRAVTVVSSPTTSTLIVPLPPIPVPGGIVLPPMLYPKTARSPGHLRGEEFSTDFDLPESDKITNSPDRLKYHFFGNDRAFRLFGESSMLASDIDVHPNINFHYTPDKNNPKNASMRVYGNITGDQFPAVETYIVDKNDRSVMLGVWQIRDGDGPVLSRDLSRGIEGDKQLPMIDIDVTVIVEDGTFTGVLSNGRIISPEEHNRYYTSLPTVAPNSNQPKPGQPVPAPLPTPTPKPGG